MLSKGALFHKSPIRQCRQCIEHSGRTQGPSPIGHAEPQVPHDRYVMPALSRASIRTHHSHDSKNLSTSRSRAHMRLRRPSSAPAEQPLTERERVVQRGADGRPPGTARAPAAASSSVIGQVSRAAPSTRHTSFTRPRRHPTCQRLHMCVRLVVCHDIQFITMHESMTPLPSLAACPRSHPPPARRTPRRDRTLPVTARTASASARRHCSSMAA